MPNAHTSIFGVDSLCPKRTSGGMYFKDPALLFSGLQLLADPKIPKSTIFKSKSKLFTPL